MKNSLKRPPIPVVSILIILLGLFNGLLYIFIVPPWQHYDEPNHFEYAWWMANHGGRPGADDADTKMRRAVARSMLNHHFFDQLNFLPDLTAKGKDIWIGEYAQVNDPPLYYAVVSIPLRIFKGEGVATQLYIGRGVSLLFYLLTIVAGFGFTNEITPPGHPIRYLLPFTLALLPGFVDLTTSLNNDVGLILFCSWFLWAAVRLIKRGLNLANFIWALIAFLLGVFTKQTGLLMLPVFAIAWLFSVFRGPSRKYAWYLLGGLTLLGLLASFNWNQPSLWYLRTVQEDPVRSKQALSPLGDYTFRLESVEADLPTKLVQIIPFDISRNLGGKTVTLGGWLWSDQPVQIQGPVLNFNNNQRQLTQYFVISNEPVFYTFSTKLPYNMSRIWITVEPFDRSMQGPAQFYMDGLTLVEGDFSQAGAPSYQDRFGTTGVWAGLPFQNLVRNASGERTWPGFRPWLDRLGPVIYPDYGREGLSLALYTVRDRSAAGWYYWNSLGQLGRTFWARFGWGNISLPGHRPYRPFAVLTILGISGAMIAIYRLRSQVDWQVIFLLGTAIAIVWGATLFRGSSFIFGRTHFLPVARYIYPVILPIMLVLVSGWFEILRWVGKTSDALKPWLIGGYVGLFLMIDLYALFNLYSYFIV